MNREITQRDVRNNHNAVVIFQIGTSSDIFRYADKIGYNAGVYGWNFDAYCIYTEKSGYVAVTCGDRPIGKVANFDIVDKYAKKAKKIADNHKLTRKQKEYYTNKLLKNCLVSLGY